MDDDKEYDFEKALEPLSNALESSQVQICV